jgi:cardiolipin synthase
MNKRFLPNFITLARLILTVPILYCLGHAHYRTALALFIVAAVSDGIDGYLARRFGWTSNFGTIVDPIADKFLVIFSMGVLASLGQLPLWFFIIVTCRDILILLTAFLVARVVGWNRFAPRYLSKINTVLQLGLILGLLLKLSYFPNIDARIFESLIDILFLTSILTVTDYLWRWRLTILQALKLGSRLWRQG